MLFVKGYKHSEETRRKIGLANKRRKGEKRKPHSEETKRKISLANKGRAKSEEWRENLSIAMKGKPPFNKGKKMSLEARKKMSERKKGDKSPTWKGGVSKQNHLIRQSLEYRLWREAVFKRDNWTCVWCGHKGEVQADHIKRFADYPELRFAIDNGRTLCKPCHRTTDTFGNRKM